MRAIRPRLSATRREIVAIFASSGAARVSSAPLPSSGVSTASSAPCPIASKIGLEPICMLPVTIRMAHGLAAMIRRVLSTPSITGITMSIRIRSGVSCGAERHRLGAVSRHPDDAVQRIDPHDPLQEIGDARQVVDDADPHASGSPIKSTTACSSVSSWKLPLVR